MASPSRRPGPRPLVAAPPASSPTKIACTLPSLEVDSVTGVDPVLYRGSISPDKTRFHRKPPHLDRAREYEAHNKSHHAARATVAMLSDQHRARQLQQEEAFDRTTHDAKFQTHFVETRLATCGVPTLNTMDVRIARQRDRVVEKQTRDDRIRDAVRRAYGSRVLDLKALDLVHIPPQVFTTLLLQLGRIMTHVNVSRNALREIPNAFVRAFPEVTSVNYKENALDELPDCMQTLTRLTELNVECNQLRRLPLALPSTLETLVASRNRLTNVPHMHTLVHLVELDLSHNHLALLPPGMPFLSQLTKIVVSGNRLVSLALLPRFVVPETPRVGGKESDDSSEENDEDEAPWTQERIERMQKQWRVEMDPLTGDTVYFHVARQRVSRVKPACFRAKVPLLAIGKAAAVATQKKSHAQWLAVFPDGWEVTLGGVCINRHRGRGTSSPSASRLVTADDTSSLQSLALTFTHHLTNETFTSIPPALDKWSALHRLQSIAIGGNQLVDLPASIGHLVQLKLLDAENNKLQSLPDTFHDLRALETVRLSMNALSWLPPSFCGLPNLTDLDLKLNRFVGLPEEIGNLQRLKVLDLSSNSLASLPKAMLSLKKLVSLRLQGNQTLVASGLLRPETLASGNIPEVCWHLSHVLLIEEVHSGQGPPISTSQVVGVGNEVWSTNHHVHKAFINAIARARESHTLDFHWKHLGFSQFPAEFFTALGGLRELRLSGQMLDMIPAAFASVCGALRVLQLRKNKIRVLDDSVFGGDVLPLEELDLEYNALESLPCSIGSLKLLRVLRASNNKLTHTGIPETMAHLTNLRELYLSHNRLIEPSPTFGSLTALEKLELSYNQLSTLATMAFAPLQHLHHVRVSVNALTDLPAELAQAPIEELHIAGNQLDSLPATVLLLKTTLRVLRMQSNKVSRLPLAFGELAALEVVETDGNPFRSPPPEIMNMGIHAIRTYLLKRHERVDEIERLLRTAGLAFDASAFTAPKLEHLIVRSIDSPSLAFLTHKHLTSFERAVDAYLNGAFYLLPSTLRGADLLTEMILQKQFMLAQAHRERVLRDVVKLCALIRHMRWLDKVDFRYDLERPWGRMGELCAVYALNPRALYDDTPTLPSVMSVVRKRVYHGFESEAFDHREEVVRDAIEHYIGVYGPVGVAHDDVPFKCGCEDLLRFNKKHEPCFRPGWSLVQVVYTAEEAERRVQDEDTVRAALDALRPQVQTFLTTTEGEKRFHSEVKMIKSALRRDLKTKKKKLEILKTKYDKLKRSRANEQKLKQKLKNVEAPKLTVAEVSELAEREEKFKELGERLEEWTKEYEKGKTQLGQGYSAFMDDVVTLLIEKIGVEVRNLLVQQQRQKAIEFGLRRPWDGPNGRDFEAYKLLVRRRMLGDGSMEREDGEQEEGGAKGAGLDAGSDNSEVSDVSFDGYDDLVSNLKKPGAGAEGDDADEDDGDDEDDEDDEEDDKEEARAEAMAKLEVSDVSDDDDAGDGVDGKRAASEDSDL